MNPGHSKVTVASGIRHLSPEPQWSTFHLPFKSGRIIFFFFGDQTWNFPQVWKQLIQLQGLKGDTGGKEGGEEECHLLWKSASSRSNRKNFKVPPCPVSLLQTPQKWEVMGWVFCHVPVCVLLGKQWGWLDNPTPTSCSCPLPLIHAVEFNF